MGGEGPREGMSADVGLPLHGHTLAIARMLECVRADGFLPW
jgi:hypothetical protein